MEPYVGQQVLVLAGVWLNKKVKGSWATPLKGEIVSFNGTVARIKPLSTWFKRKRLYERDFEYKDVYDLEHYERDHWVNLNLYQTIRDPNEPVGGEVTKEQFEDVRDRVAALEKKYGLLSNHVNDKFIPASTLNPDDL